jgi:hypothetical protein
MRSFKPGDKVQLKTLDRILWESKSWAREAGMKLNELYIIELIINGNIVLKGNPFAHPPEKFKLINKEQRTPTWL